MAKFRIKKGAKLSYNDGERSNTYTEGQEVDLPVHVAADVANRYALEPLDDQGRYALMPIAGVDANVLATTGAAHERVQALQTELDQIDERRKLVVDRLDAAKREQGELVEKMQAGQPATQAGESINGVPVRVLDHGQGGTTAGVVHGEPTQLQPGASGTIQPGSQPPKPDASTQTGPGVAAAGPGPGDTRQPANADVQSR